MIKKIAIEQLRIGMYIHDLDCGWMAHPFLTNRLLVSDAAIIKKIAAAGIRAFYIDTTLGKDVEDAPTEAQVKEELDQQIQEIVHTAPVPRDPPTLAEEIVHARKLHGETTTLVRNMMHDVRLGKQIEVEQCDPLVDDILDSVFRFPEALLPLSQVKSRDQYTYQHSVSVAALAVAFGRVLDLPREAIKSLAMGGLLHDVGKALVPEGVLNKPGKLSDAEFLAMKSHAGHTATLLGKTPGISEITFLAASQHHERYDGTGYPKSLKGDAISIYGQMLAIVDVYDAISSVRIYHQGMPPTEALRKLFEWSKYHFNPSLVQAFIKGIGIYPAGSLVRMASKRMGIVKAVRPESLLQPVVTIFYHAETKAYQTPETVDLSESSDKIVAHESFEAWGIDQASWL